jgi:hypothetical protein
VGVVVGVDWGRLRARRVDLGRGSIAVTEVCFTTADVDVQTYRVLEICTMSS